MQSDVVWTLADMEESIVFASWRPDGDVTFADFLSHIWGLDDSEDDADEPPAAQEEDCSVCLEPMTSPVAAVTSMLPPRAAARVAGFCGAALRRTPCGHAFHSTCLERWAVRLATCPVCRGPLRRSGRSSFQPEASRALPSSSPSDAGASNGAMGAPRS